ncbi:MAG: TonB family protein [Nitrospirales bacterium]|nr:TonB family protein [Nitrospira sp.]MDR4501848.1 TonB family protein [Nitrospirales bacterium]
MSTTTVLMPPDLTSRKVLFCVVASLTLHAGLLAGLQMWYQAEPPVETVQLVQVTLVPAEVPADSLPSSEDAQEPVAPPPMRQPSRATASQPVSTPSPPALSQAQPLMTTPAVAFKPTPPAEDHRQLSHKPRVLKDTKAADALFAQHATKMVKRSTATEAALPSASPMLTTKASKITQTRALSSHVQAIHTAPSTTQATRSRRLVATPPVSGGNGLAKIRVRHSVRPVYPRLAKEQGWEGTVLVKILVRTDGIPDHVTIQKSSGHQVLDDAAMEAIRQWRFAPAMDGNFPVEKYLQVPLKFGLQR